MLVTVTDTTRSPHGVCNTAVCFHSNHEGAIQPAPLTGSATYKESIGFDDFTDTTRSPHGVCNTAPVIRYRLPLDTTRSPHGVCNSDKSMDSSPAPADTTRSPHGVCNFKMPGGCSPRCRYNPLPSRGLQRGRPTRHKLPMRIQPAPLTGSATILFDVIPAIDHKIQPAPLTGSATFPSHSKHDLRRIQPAPLTGSATHTTWMQYTTIMIQPAPLTGSATPSDWWR